MGWGDDLMYLGQVQAQNTPVRPTRKTRPRTISPLWHGEQLISTQHAQQLDEMQLNTDGKWKRPYHHSFGDYKPHAGRVHLTEQEQALAEEYKDFILLCPDAKTNAHHATNKHWPHWQALATQLNTKHPDIPLLRLKHNEELKDLVNVTNVMTHTIRHSYAIVKNARCVITTDGFYHHASASHNAKCIVIYGSCTSPRHLGYPGQLNIVVNDAHSPCYTIHENCEQCKHNMNSIRAEHIVKHLEQYLNLKQAN